MSFEPPIQNIDRIDVLAKQRDDSVDLAIAASGPIDESPTTLAMLERKILNYIAEVGSEAFCEEFGTPTIERTRISIICEYQVSAKAQKLIESLRPIAEKAGASLRLAKSVSGD